MSFTVSVVVSQVSEFSSFPAGIMDQQGLSHRRVPVERKNIFKTEAAFKKKKTVEKCNMKMESSEMEYLDFSFLNLSSQELQFIYL